MLQEQCTAQKRRRVRLKVGVLIRENSIRNNEHETKTKNRRKRSTRERKSWGFWKERNSTRLAHARPNEIMHLFNNSRLTNSKRAKKRKAGGENRYKGASVCIYKYTLFITREEFRGIYTLRRGCKNGLYEYIYKYVCVYNIKYILYFYKSTHHTYNDVTTVGL